VGEPGPNSLYRIDANGTSYTAAPILGPDTTKNSQGATGILAYTSSPSMTDATIIPQDKWRVERSQGVSCTNFAQIATVTSAAFNDTGLATTTSYSYRVRGTDAAGNLGPCSNVAGATTLAL
jgi:chitodextrinase